MLSTWKSLSKAAKSRSKPKSIQLDSRIIARGWMRRGGGGLRSKFDGGIIICINTLKEANRCLSLHNMVSFLVFALITKKNYLQIGERDAGCEAPGFSAKQGYYWCLKHPRNCSLHVNHSKWSAQHSPAVVCC